MTEISALKTGLIADIAANGEAQPGPAAAAPEKAFDPLTDYIQDDRPAGKPRKDKPHAHGKGKPGGGDKTYKRPKPQGGKKPFKKGPKKPRD